MTGQDLLDRMEDLDNELQLQSGEANVARGLRALNVAQDYFETLAAHDDRILGSHTSTVVTAANTETTSFPTGLLRLDSLKFVSPDTGRTTYTLDPIEAVGGHAPGGGLVPILLNIVVSPGKPHAYWTNGTNFYWDPLPDAVHTLRWYGWQRQSDISAAGTFAYDDGVVEPLAVFAVAILRRGVDDPVSDLGAFAHTIFQDQLQMMRGFTREHARGRQYLYTHDT